MRLLVSQYITALAHWGRSLPTPRATNSSELPNNACCTRCRSFASKDYDGQRKTVELMSIKFLSQFRMFNHNYLIKGFKSTQGSYQRGIMLCCLFEYRCLQLSLVPLAVLSPRSRLSCHSTWTALSAKGGKSTACSKSPRKS